MKLNLKLPDTVPSIGHNPLISEGIIKLLNYRIQQEEFSSRIYLAMSMWLTNTGYLGAGKLWAKYAAEEMTHADWSRDYLLSMGVQPSVPKLDAPLQVFSGLPEIIKASYDHEIEVTRQIKDLATAAMKEGDHLVYTLTHKYLAEQVEEHDKTQNLMDRLAAFGTDKIALRLLDNELGSMA